MKYLSILIIIVCIFVLAQCYDAKMKTKDVLKDRFEKHPLTHKFDTIKKGLQERIEETNNPTKKIKLQKQLAKFEQHQKHFSKITKDHFKESTD
mmetsp:Transcript_12021/g.18165  ORF Transcript_12021/g.18165 Transcript_12021/m.18165 type:complete len:94 (+) Transcript_12021:133-414(+)